MSSMRNAVQRRNHRERAQPIERQKWGLLEKPKDYKLRAADHKIKKRKLQQLQQKARERNEDEFYFGMMSSQSQGGVRVAKRGQDGGAGSGGVLSGDVVKLMKTQDAGYLRTVLQQTRKERERIEEEVVSGNVGVRLDLEDVDRRVVFDEDGQQVSSKKSDAESSEGDENSDEDNGATSQKPSALAKKRKKLQAIKDRERDLATALREVEEQRARMNGSVGGVSKDGVKFKMRQRRR